MLRKRFGVTSSGPVLALFATVMLCLVFASSCGRDSDDPSADADRTLLSAVSPWGDPTGDVTGYGSCKSFGDPLLDNEIASFQTAVAWEYDGEGTLSLHHLNACFNCCFEEAGCEIIFEGRSITVMEQETYGDSGACYCLCLVDVDYQVTGLSPGKYTIKVDELYFHEGDEVIEFEVMLKGTPSSGIFILDRCHYPWSVDPESTWEVVDWGTGADWVQCAVTWDYDDYGVLHLRHVRRIDWCCIVDLTVDISYESGAFSLHDTATDPGFHFWVPSVYGYEVEIRDLLPGTYQFTFTGNTVYLPGLPPVEVFDPLELTIDLTSQPTGEYCIEL